MKKDYGGSINEVHEEIADGRIHTVADLWQRMRLKRPRLGFEEFLSELNASTSVRVEEPVILHFEDYLKSWRYGFRAWLTATGILVTFFLVESLRVGWPLVAVRWVAGTFLTLVAPGFTFTWALFPSRRQPAGLNRLALTIAMSLFLVPATALLLNYTPIGIHAEPVAAILTALSLSFLYVGMRREFVLARRI